MRLDNADQLAHIATEMRVKQASSVVKNTHFITLLEEDLHSFNFVHSCIYRGQNAECPLVVYFRQKRRYS